MDVVINFSSRVLKVKYIREEKRKDKKEWKKSPQKQT
jgi:hypothetical protein